MDCSGTRGVWLAFVLLCWCRVRGDFSVTVAVAYWLAAGRGGKEWAQRLSSDRSNHDPMDSCAARRGLVAIVTAIPLSFTSSATSPISDQANLTQPKELDSSSHGWRTLARTRVVLHQPTCSCYASAPAVPFYLLKLNVARR
jgi:hypothetical protein